MTLIEFTEMGHELAEDVQPSRERDVGSVCRRASYGLPTRLRY